MPQWGQGMSKLALSKMLVMGASRLGRGSSVGAPLSLEQVTHADLARVFGGGAAGQSAAMAVAVVGAGGVATIKGQRKAAQHGGDDPAGVALGQQQLGGVAFGLADRAAAGFNFVDHNPGFGVRNHSHFYFSIGGDGYARQGCGDLCRNHHFRFERWTPKLLDQVQRSSFTSLHRGEICPAQRFSISHLFQRGVFTAPLRAACGGFLVTLRRLTGAAFGWGRAFFTLGKAASALERHTGGAWWPAKCAPRSSLLLDAGGADLARIFGQRVGQKFLAGGVKP